MQEVPYVPGKKPRKVSDLLMPIGSFVFEDDWSESVGQTALACRDTHAKYVNELVTESPLLAGQRQTTN